MCKSSSSSLPRCSRSKRGEVNITTLLTLGWYAHEAVQCTDESIMRRTSESCFYFFRVHVRTPGRAEIQLCIFSRAGGLTPTCGTRAALKSQTNWLHSQSRRFLSLRVLTASQKNRSRMHCRSVSLSFPTKEMDRSTVEHSRTCGRS